MDVLWSSGLICFSVGCTLGVCYYNQPGYRARPYLVPTWMLFCVLGWLLITMQLLP